MRSSEPGQKQLARQGVIELRLKGPAGPVLAASARLKLSVNVLSESENCPNHTGVEIRRYLRIEPVGANPTRCTIRLVPPTAGGADQAPAEMQLAVCGVIPLRQIGDLITALIETATHLGEVEVPENGAGDQEFS